MVWPAVSCHDVPSSSKVKPTEPERTTKCPHTFSAVWWAAKRAAGTVVAVNSGVVRASRSPSGSTGGVDDVAGMSLRLFVGRGVWWLLFFKSRAGLFSGRYGQ